MQYPTTLNVCSQRFRLLGPQGLTGIAVAAVDMAIWDVVARTAQVSLVTLLGASSRPLRAYGGVGYDGVRGSADAAERWARAGMSGIKAKIGYPSVQEDLDVIRAMRSAVGNDIEIMVDYNQCLNAVEARTRLRALDDEGLCWNRGTDYGTRLRWPQRLRARDAHTASGRRKLVGTGGLRHSD
jgi:mandelate racemase